MLLVNRRMPNGTSDGEEEGRRKAPSYLIAILYPVPLLPLLPTCQLQPCSRLTYRPRYGSVLLDGPTVTSMAGGAMPPDGTT